MQFLPKYRKHPIISSLFIRCVFPFEKSINTKFSLWSWGFLLLLGNHFTTHLKETVGASNSSLHIFSKDGLKNSDSKVQRASQRTRLYAIFSQEELPWFWSLC